MITTCLWEVRSLEMVYRSVVQTMYVWLNITIHAHSNYTRTQQLYRRTATIQAHSNYTGIQQLYTHTTNIQAYNNYTRTQQLYRHTATIHAHSNYTGIQLLDGPSASITKLTINTINTAHTIIHWIIPIYLRIHTWTHIIFIYLKAACLCLHWLTNSQCRHQHYKATTEHHLQFILGHAAAIGSITINFLKPKDIYIFRTAQLTSRRYILNIYSTNIHTEYFKHAA